MEPTVFVVICEWEEGVNYDVVTVTNVVAAFTTKDAAESHKQKLESTIKRKDPPTEYLIEEIPLNPN